MFKRSPFPRIPGPFPPIPGPVIDIIVKGTKKLWDVVTNSKSSQEISKRDKLNEENISDVIDYNMLLNEFISEIENDIHILEEKIILECTEYYEELIGLVQDVEKSKSINLRSNNIKRLLERLKRDAKGSLAKSIHRKISLDNSELKRTLNLPAGQVKKDRIQEFKQEVIKKVLDDFIFDVKEYLEDLSEDITNDIERIIADISSNSEMLLKELTTLEDSENDEEKAKELVVLAEEKMLLSDAMLNELRR